MLKTQITTFSLASLLIVSAFSPAQARKFFAYTDASGVTHYSDRRPNTNREVTAMPIKVDPKSKVIAKNIGTDKAPTYAFSNKFYGPVQLEVRFLESRNVAATPSLPHIFQMQSREEKTLFSIHPGDSYRPWSYQLTWRYSPGPNNANHDPKQAYLIPFASSDAYLIGQGFNGQATHQDASAQYAIDITMPVGTPIVAARDGIIMDVEQDFFGAGKSKRYMNRANAVRILHADGTMAIYVHLREESVIVRPGQPILAGEMIARSGNTGYSSGPHLHFAVQKNEQNELISLPFKFQTQNGLQEPVEGTLIRGHSADSLTVAQRR